MVFGTYSSVGEARRCAAIMKVSDKSVPKTAGLIVSDLEFRINVDCIRNSSNLLDD
jgi:hypothetical protein